MGATGAIDIFPYKTGYTDAVHFCLMFFSFIDVGHHFYVICTNPVRGQHSANTPTQGVHMIC